MAKAFLRPNSSISAAPTSSGAAPASTAADSIGCAIAGGLTAGAEAGASIAGGATATGGSGAGTWRCHHHDSAASAITVQADAPIQYARFKQISLGGTTPEPGENPDAPCAGPIDFNIQTSQPARVNANPG
jgi:hypothetical protein